MAKVKLSDKEQVEQHIAQLPPEMQTAVSYLRKVMLSIDKEISEHIKWNSPAFYYSGAMKEFDPKEYKRDILVLNLRKGKIMCVLPTGVNIKVNTELLEGNFPDGRKIIQFEDLHDIKQKESRLREAIKEWLSSIDQ